MRATAHIPHCPSPLPSLHQQTTNAAACAVLKLSYNFSVWQQQKTVRQVHTDRQAHTYTQGGKTEPRLVTVQVANSIPYAWCFNLTVSAITAFGINSTGQIKSPRVSPRYLLFLRHHMRLEKKFQERERERERKSRYVWMLHQATATATGNAMQTYCWYFSEHFSKLTYHTRHFLGVTEGRNSTMVLAAQPVCQ
jgi:hypothetical protein